MSIHKIDEALTFNATCVVHIRGMFFEVLDWTIHKNQLFFVIGIEDDEIEFLVVGGEDQTMPYEEACGLFGTDYFMDKDGVEFSSIDKERILIGTPIF